MDTARKKVTAFMELLKRQGRINLCMFPEQYFTLVAGAQKSPKTPYKVIEVDPSQIILYDFKSLSQQIRNLSVDEYGD